MLLLVSVAIRSLSPQPIGGDGEKHGVAFQDVVCIVSTGRCLGDDDDDNDRSVCKALEGSHCQDQGNRPVLYKAMDCILLTVFSVS